MNEHEAVPIAEPRPSAGGSGTPRTDAVMAIENNWGYIPGSDGDGVTAAEAHDHCFSALQKLARQLEAELDHWKANHANMVQRCAVLSQRPDLPVDRLPAIANYEQQIAMLEKYIQDMVNKAADGSLHGYRELGAKCASLEERADALRAALQELVRLKKMKDAVESHNSSLTGRMMTNAQAYEFIKEYKRRKPLAWTAAMIALGQKPASEAAVE